MEQQSLTYSFIALGGVKIAEYAVGNFNPSGARRMEELPKFNSMTTWLHDGYTYYYLVEDRCAYCVVAVQSTPRQIPIAFLERIKKGFTKSKSGGFGPKLKEEMIYCIDHPQEISKVEAPEGKMDNQQVESIHSAAADVADNPIPGVLSSKAFPIGLALPIVRSKLNMDKVLQLDMLCSRVRKNEVSKTDFLNQVRRLVGDTILKDAISQVLAESASRSTTLKGSSHSLPPQKETGGPSLKPVVKAPIRTPTDKTTRWRCWVLPGSGTILRFQRIHDEPKKEAVDAFAAVRAAVRDETQDAAVSRWQSLVEQHRKADEDRRRAEETESESD